MPEALHVGLASAINPCGEFSVNASINTAASAIAAQPLPSAGVSKFFALKPRLFINGEWVEARSGRTVQVFDPATGRQIGLVADAGPEDVDRAVAAARAALETGPWATMTPSGREAGLEQATEMGPLVSKEQQERVLGYIESGRKQGASVAVGGEAPSHPGYFVKPTVLVNVNQDMRVVREEIFGPVLVAQRFDDLDDVVKAANDTTYGLGASIWTNNLTAAHRLIPRIKAGTVWVNCHNLVDPNMPFGGYKQSGFGREHGRVAVEMYTETKSVCIML